MANGNQETYNQYFMQQNFSYGGFPTQVNNVESTEPPIPYMVQHNYPCSVHPTQVNNMDPSYMNTHTAQSGPHTHNPYIVQQNHTNSMLPRQTNNTGTRTRPPTAAELWSALKHFKSEKETAERHCSSLQAHCDTLQAEKDAIHTQAQRTEVYRQNLEKNNAALQVANMHMQNEREYYRRLSAHLVTVILKAQKEQHPPSDATVQQILARGQSRALHGRPNPASQAQARVQIMDPLSGPSEHSQNAARTSRAPLTPPASLRDGPTPPIANTKETNPSAASKEVVDLSDDSSRGVKRKSPDGGWDNSLRTPPKPVWEHLGKQKVEEKAVEMEKDIIGKGRAACEEARKAAKKTSQKTTKKPRKPARKNSIATKPDDKQPEQADTTAETEDLEAFEHELKAVLDEDAATKEAELSEEPLETMTPLNPKGQSLSASDPGVEARAAALEEGLLSVSSPVMSEYEDGEVPPFDDLFDEMEASSVRQD